MKKTLLLLTAIVFAVTSCEYDGTYKNGDYKVKFSEPHYGWTAFVEFTLDKDEIANVDYDYLDADGNLKSENDGYQAAMESNWVNLENGDSIQPGIGPQDYCPDIEAAIKQTEIVPEYVEIDNITGATSSVKSANALMNAGLEAAIVGTEGEIVIDPLSK